jgi:hypothetical protein
LADGEVVGWKRCWRGDDKGGIGREWWKEVRVCGGEVGRLGEGLCGVGQRELTRRKEDVSPDDGGWVGQVGDGVGKVDVDMVKK